MSQPGKERDVRGFVRAKGSKLVNGDGREIILRGVGFGNWLLPEGYMWKFPEQGDRPRRIEQMVENLIGPAKAEWFWELYYERYIGEADIERIAGEGFNSLRIPINARFLMEEGETLQIKEHHLAYIDRVIKWCRNYHLYVILDLHGAPGGQTGSNIDDSEKDHPNLFTDENNKQLTIGLWRMLADHYKDEWIVAGYDLLNEPLPDWFSAYNHHIMPLYKEIVSAIREVDTRHMIILEGVHWATAWSIFTEKFDDNLMLQFHKYWSNPDTESLSPYLAKREEWNVPIFMGEGGENSNEWYIGAFQLFEEHGISWNFWPWKKLDTENTPCSINMPNNWHLLIRYLEGGDCPNPAIAESILWEYLNNLALVNCTYHSDVVRSLFRRAPIRIPSIFYGFKGKGVSFGTTLDHENLIGFREQDCTDIRFVEGGELRSNFWHGRGKSDKRLFVQLAAGDWLAYEVTVNDSHSAKFTIRMMISPVEESACMKLTINGEDSGSLEVAGDENSWQQVELNVMPPLGTERMSLVILAEQNAVRIEWIEIG
ncbi:cellulase family glycosylhydrolase [Paenibacillus sp. Soil750]|uniref:cellulase family glycosylhydrolase n=1 Tax=Paenibacillus sp. Soil750 TaxID=1736398 RepID=UPI000701DBD4|nr:cellulase family glycosylhydrolase [Paenibacillus sp. Soil750]KRE57860.1 glycoside hydrolase [Paenibacillus sp. Soil750]